MKHINRKTLLLSVIISALVIPATLWTIFPYQNELEAGTKPAYSPGAMPEVSPNIYAYISGAISGRIPSQNFNQCNIDVLGYVTQVNEVTILQRQLEYSNGLWTKSYVVKVSLGLSAVDFAYNISRIIQKYGELTYISVISGNQTYPPFIDNGLYAISVTLYEFKPPNMIIGFVLSVWFAIPSFLRVITVAVMMYLIILSLIVLTAAILHRIFWKEEATVSQPKKAQLAPILKHRNTCVTPYLR